MCSDKMILFVFFIAPLSWCVVNAVCPDIVTKKVWDGLRPLHVNYLPRPVDLVIIQHTVTPTCSTFEPCKDIVQSIQNTHMEDLRYWDIGMSFLVGGDGKVYEGSGWLHVGAHTLGYNKKSIAISFIGNFNTEQISKLRASQSPIAISLQRCPTWSSLEPLRFRGYWDNDSDGILVNTGQTAYFTFDSPSRPRLSGGPLIGDYIFEQMHFHWSVDDFTGCEHVLDGHGYAAECHLVHYNSKYESLEAAVPHADGLAVVGYLLEAVDAPNPSFDMFIEGLEQIKKPDHSVVLSAESLSWMNREDVTTGSYVTYKGSLTTPPYGECVTWIIYEKAVQIGSEQLGLLRQLEGADSVPIERNVRPTQRHPPGHSVIYVKQVKSKL